MARSSVEGMKVVEQFGLAGFREGPAQQVPLGGAGIEGQPLAAEGHGRDLVLCGDIDELVERVLLPSSPKQ